MEEKIKELIRILENEMNGHKDFADYLLKNGDEKIANYKHGTVNGIEIAIKRIKEELI